MLTVMNDGYERGSIELILPGCEHPWDPPVKPVMTQTCGAESGARAGEIAPEVAEVVRAWPTLPADVRAGILAAVRRAGEGAKP